MCQMRISRELAVPENLKLYDFQVEAIHKMLNFLETNRGVYNSCEPGLGKTIQTIVTLNTLQLKKILIVCPAIMRLVWFGELNKWFIDQQLEVCAVLSRKDLPDTETADIVIISYDLIAKEYTDKFLIKSWDVLILDESHAIKNKSALRTKTILKKYWGKADLRIALSGTPMTRNVTDCFTLFSAFSPIEFPNFYTFANRYSYPKFNGFARVYEGLRNSEELSKKIRSKFFIRYKKEDVLKELPNKIYQKIPLPKELALNVPIEDKEEVEHELLELKKSLEEGSAPKINLKGKLIKSRQEQGLRKVSHVEEYLRELLDQSIPVVVFAWHREVISQLAKCLKTYLPVVITGDTSAQDRQKGIEDFQAGKTNLFIGNYLAAGVGITLTRSSTVVLAEFDFSPANISQGISRVHRMTQKSTVLVYYLVVENSLEERIIKIVMDKLTDFEKVLDA